MLVEDPTMRESPPLPGANRNFIMKPKSIVDMERHSTYNRTNSSYSSSSQVLDGIGINYLAISQDLTIFNL